MNSIEIKNLTKRYGKFYAVDNLGFEIKQGDFVGFLGVNGEGKSTTVNMLSTILTPDSGDAYLCGYKLGKEDMEIRKTIGVVYQSNVLDDLFTVKENIVTRSKMLGLDDKTIRDRLADLSDILKLSDIMDKRYRVLSGGQKRRCEIAFALMHSPRILFLDEPTTGLDLATRVDVWDAVEMLRANTDMTVWTFSLCAVGRTKKATKISLDYFYYCLYSCDSDYFAKAFVTNGNLIISSLSFSIMLSSLLAAPDG